MYSLSHVIALLDGSLARLVRTIAWRIRHVGPVLREHTTQTGNNFSAQTMLLQHLWSPAPVASPKKPKAAKRTSAASKSTSKKPSVAQTAKSPSSRGNSTQTPVRQTRQAASQVQKQSKAVAQHTPLEQLHPLDLAVVQTYTDNLYGVLGKHKIPASKTRQPAAPAAKRKRSVAKQDTQAPSRK